MRKIDSKTYEVADGLELVVDDCGHPYYVIVSTRPGDPLWPIQEITNALKREGFQIWCDTSSWHHERDWSTILVHEGGYNENAAMQHNARGPSDKFVSELTKKSLTDLRRMQALTVRQIELAYKQRNTKALEELQVREREIQHAIHLKHRPSDGSHDPEAHPSVARGDKIYRGRGSYRDNASDYYVWPLGKGNLPLAGEGPFGPYSLDSAKTTARIRATKGSHDYGVTRGADPATFKVERVYQHGSGERLSSNARSRRIATITDAYIRTYSDSGQVTAYVEWLDEQGKSGRTEGEPDNPHMEALFARAKREGVRVRKETW